MNKLLNEIGEPPFKKQGSTTRIHKKKADTSGVSEKWIEDLLLAILKEPFRISLLRWLRRF